MIARGVAPRAAAGISGRRRVSFDDGDDAMSGDWKSGGQPPGGDKGQAAGWGEAAKQDAGGVAKGSGAAKGVDPRSAGREGSFTEVTRTSLGSRVKGALAGVVIGIAMVPGAAWMLFWNEGRAVQTAQSLGEGAGAVQAAEAGRVDAAMEGRLVHASAPLAVAGPLRDPDFGVQTTGAVRLVRSVEMYQWREERRSETRTNLGGAQETATIYNYTRGWSAQAIDSSRFRQPEGRFNPQMRYAARETLPAEARLGARRLTERQLAGFGEARPIRLDAVTFVPPAGAQVVDGGLYLGRDPASPQIGDMRVSFTQVPAGTASIVARQSGDGFEAYQTRAGDRLFMLRAGSLPAAEMFEQAVQANSVMTWALRGAGALLMFIGFGLVLRPFSVVGSVVPFLGSIVAAGASLVSLMLTLVLAPLVVAVAWFWFRPLVGAVVLALGLAAAFAVSRVIAKRRAAAAATPQPA